MRLEKEAVMMYGCTMHLTLHRIQRQSVQAEEHEREPVSVWVYLFWDPGRFEEGPY
jgi:hypothetical protein